MPKEGERKPAVLRRAVNDVTGSGIGGDRPGNGEPALEIFGKRPRRLAGEGLRIKQGVLRRGRGVLGCRRDRMVVGTGPGAGRDGRGDRRFFSEIVQIDIEGARPQQRRPGAVPPGKVYHAVACTTPDIFGMFNVAPVEG